MSPGWYEAKVAGVSAEHRGRGIRTLYPFTALRVPRPPSPGLAKPGLPPSLRVPLRCSGMRGWAPRSLRARRLKSLSPPTPSSALRFDALGREPFLCGFICKLLTGGLAGGACCVPCVGA